MKFERIKPGMVLYDAHTYRMGNTTLRSWGVWPVYVISVDAEKRTARVRWNAMFNPEETYSERRLRRLREKPPVLVKSGWSYRLETRDERIEREAVEKASAGDKSEPRETPSASDVKKPSP